MGQPNKSLLGIDLNRLEEEAAGQPKRMFLWGSKLAEARSKSKRAKNKAKLVKAELWKNILLNYDEYGFASRPTEKTMEAVVDSQADYIKAQEEQVQAEYEEDVLFSFVEALRDRREQIGNEVKLYGQMYWSKPDTRATESARVNERVKKDKDSI